MSTADLLGGYTAADEENDSDAKSGAPSSEDENGVDLNGDNTDQDDSSEEGEDDSEAEREVKEGELEAMGVVDQLGSGLALSPDSESGY